MTQATLTVPAAEANRRFSKLMRAAREGTKITITSHGQPVAELRAVEVGAQEAEARRIAKAHRALLKHLRSVKPHVVGPWTRDELYERD